MVVLEPAQEPVVVLEPAQEPVVVQELGQEPVVVQELGQEPLVVQEPAQEPVVVPETTDDIQELSIMLDVVEMEVGQGDADQGEEMEVEEWEHAGETYYVDVVRGDIYNIDEGEVIGKWIGDAETGEPKLN